MLLNRQKGFNIGPTVNPCTKGLWIWTKPIYGEDEKGKRIPILIIDTEGLGALHIDSNHDLRIFALSILLSSHFLYNSIGGINENLQNLNFIINLSTFIKLKSDDTGTNSEELSNQFPSFLWILRDFSLESNKDKIENITTKEYLEKALEETKNIQDPNNKIRKLIKTYFKEIDCHTLVRPVINEKQLQNIEDLPPIYLRPTFLEQIIELRKKILRRIKAKTLNGNPLNGEMYLHLVKDLISALNSGNVLNIENIWLSICKDENYKVFQEAEQRYDDFLDEYLENNDIKSIHKEAKELALEHFKNKALGEISQEYLIKLKNKIKEKYCVNLEENKDKIIRVLNKWSSILEQRIQNNEFKSIDELTENLKTLEEKLYQVFSYYNGKSELFNEFKITVLTSFGKFYVKKAENEKIILEEQIKEIKEYSKNDKNNYNNENDRNKEIINLNNRINELEKENKDLHNKLNQKEIEIKMLKSNK